MVNHKYIVGAACALAMQATYTGALSAEGAADIVGLGTISTPAREFAASLGPDGSELFFNRITEEAGIYIWVANLNGDGKPARKIWFSDDRYSDVDPFVSRSGDRLYFSSDRPLPGSGSSEPTPDNNTWYSPRTESGWGEPRFAGAAVNSAASETFVSESARGELVFTRFGEGSGRARPAYLMIAKRNGDGFETPQRIETLPRDLRVSNPAVSPDGRLIVAAGTRGDAPKLYFSRKSPAGDWTQFRALNEVVNVPEGVQFAPYISNDGQWLYFSSERPAPDGAGDDDIYRVRLELALPD